MSKKKKPIPYPDLTAPILGEPTDVWEQVNKYGTYEVQDTVDTENAFPCIGYEGSAQNCVDAANKQIQKKPEQ